MECFELLSWPSNLEFGRGSKGKHEIVGEDGKCRRSDECEPEERGVAYTCFPTLRSAANQLGEKYVLLQVILLT